MVKKPSEFGISRESCDIESSVKTRIAALRDCLPLKRALTKAQFKYVHNCLPPFFYSLVCALTGSGPSDCRFRIWLVSPALAPAACFPSPAIRQVPSKSNSNRREGRRRRRHVRQAHAYRHRQHGQVQAQEVPPGMPQVVPGRAYGCVLLSSCALALCHVAQSWRACWPYKAAVEDASLLTHVYLSLVFPPSLSISSPTQASSVLR